MADEDNLIVPPPPRAGEQIRLPVRIGPNRQVLLPDQVIVAGAVGIGVEIVCLRNELVVSAQNATIVTSGAAGVEVSNNLAEVSSQMFDVGHVRLSLNAAIELSYNILKHATMHEGLDRQVAIDRLKTELESVT